MPRFWLLVMLVFSVGAFPRTSTVHHHSSAAERLRSASLRARPAELVTAGRPIDPAGWPHKFPAQEHCSKCGLCESSYVSYVKDACSFLPDGMMKEMDDGGWEAKVHGRGRQKEDSLGKEADELRFGVLYEPMYLARGAVPDEKERSQDPSPQWTGVVTSIAESMLTEGLVDAVVCIGASNAGTPLDWATPEPLLARTMEEVRRGRGVKPSLAPTLRILDDLRRASDLQSLLVCGVGCAVQALRAVEAQIRLDNPLLRDIYVLGTNCADNSPTPQAAQNFVERGILGSSGSMAGGSVRGYEFMTDFKIHVKMEEGDAYLKKPYFCLPPSLAAPSIAPSCLACFDYTNALADVVVGYMGAPTADRMDTSWQTLSIRNARGREMVDAAVRQGRLEMGPTATGEGSHQTVALSTMESDTIVQAMTGKIVDEEQEGLPLWLGNVMAQFLRFVGPKGVAFARYSIDYHLLRNYLHVLEQWGPEEVSRRTPDYARRIVSSYRDSYEQFSKKEAEILDRKLWLESRTNNLS